MSELGSWLIRAREARGLTLEDAERDTRISRRYLQALEKEQFEVIPAPVYARGFLRSYSQYLGLDPQEMMALFPRDDDGGYSNDGPDQPATQQRPLNPVSASRPSWSRPDRDARANGSRRGAAAAGEPMIGVDIGVPVPVRNMQADPATQTRALAVLLVAAGAIVAMVLVALLISNVGGEGGPPSAGSLAGSATQTARAGATAAGAGASVTVTPGSSGLEVTRGIVPDVTGQPVAIARLALQEAGYRVREQLQKDSQPKSAVLQQSPAAGIELAEGLEVRIVVSEGP